MKNVKKIMALALALIVMIAPVNVRAAEVLSNDLAKDFTAKFFETSYPDNLADMVEMFIEADNTDDLGEAYEQAFNVLSKGQQDKLGAYGATVAAVGAFVEYVNNTQNDIDTDHLINYIDNGDKSSFDTALENHLGHINDILIKQNVTTEILHSGFGKVDQAFRAMASIKLAINFGAEFTIFEYNTKSKIFRLQELNTKKILKDKSLGISDVDSALAGLNEFVSYANKLTTHDKNLMVDYLAELGMLEEYTHSTGGGGSSSGGGGSSSGSSSDKDKASATSPAEQKEAATKTQKALENLSDTVAQVKDEKTAYEAVKNVTDALAKATTTIKAIENAADQKAVVTQVTSLLESTVQALDMIDNAGAVKLKVEAMIKDVAKLKVAAGKSLGNATKIDQALVKLAEKAIEKVATVKATSSDLTKVDFAAQAVKANAVKADMQKVLTENKIKGNKALETKITVKVPTVESAKEVAVTLGDLTEAFKAIDKVKIESSVACFELEAGTFGNLEAKELKLSATVIGKTALTASQLAKLPAGVTNIIDLNASVNGEQVSKFKKAIEVSVPYTLKEGENPAKISVYLLTDEGKIQKVAGKYDSVTGQISVSRKHFSKYFIAESTDTFGDIARYSWAKEQIETLAGKGIIGGIGENKFDPSANISRASFVALIVRMLQLDGDVSTLKFEDVSADTWYAKEVAAAVEAGITNGKSASTFAPNDTITRQEVAVVMSNAMKTLGYTIEDTGSIITNNVVDANNIAKWAKNASSTVYRDGIITGKTGNKFDPTGKATRAEAAVMMYRLYFAN